MNKKLLSPAVGAFVIAVLACMLYIPFLHNGVVFDDHGFFTHASGYDRIKTPFDFRPRTFPNFTLAEVRILFGTLVANRVVSLILHILSGWILFGLLESLLRQAIANSRGRSYLADDSDIGSRATMIAFIGAAFFVISPVAVYGAGYLAQRTTLFAALFGLLSLWYYRRAFAENRLSDIIAAALFYSAAVFSKEHIVMLPLAAVVLTVLYTDDWRANVKRVIFFLLLCAPAAITVIITARQVIGAGYEPSYALISSQIHGIPLLDKPHGPWMVSSVIQAGFFYDYLTYWIAPNVTTMAIDMRVDFARLWSSWLLFPKALIFIATPFAGLYLLKKRGLAALFACGLLYAWLLYITELVSVRFQEPFVLYRSYLWAPGYIMMIVAVCAALPRKWVAIAAIPVLVASMALAYERLATLESEYTVWNDAAKKLQPGVMVGADRIFYNRGLWYLKKQKFNEALADFSHAAELRPAAHYFYHRGVTYYWLNDQDKAEADFDKAFSMNSKDGAIQFARGLLFERRGCINAAREAYTAAMKLGFATGKLRLAILEKNVAANAGKPAVTPTGRCPS